MTPTHMMFLYLGPLGSDSWHGIYSTPPAFPTPAHLTDFDSALQPTLSPSLVPCTFLSTFQIFTRSLYETQTCISSSVVTMPRLMHWEPRPQAIEHSSFPVYTCLYIRILYSGNYGLDLSARNFLSAFSISLRKCISAFSERNRPQSAVHLNMERNVQNLRFFCAFSFPVNLTFIF